ncbi:hypothetical protein, conserved [Eimeria necatrix]|uniref:Uncharacterized protein n=1 Tax=Eimeria necatrix TaxID=51315 RepID=U6MWD9_9EIME|nr:hypothetical protein, conserved [Eimeria necatrix]CDJ67333.1 hypothetical protein, conserved [Eimeria necatrix]
MQSYRPVNALSMCAAVLALSGGETHGFMVGRRASYQGSQPMEMPRKEAVSQATSLSPYDADEGSMQLQPPIFDSQESSFVEASGDEDSDDSDDDDDEKDEDKGKGKEEKKEEEKAEGHGGGHPPGGHPKPEGAGKGKEEAGKGEGGEAHEHEKEGGGPKGHKEKKGGEEEEKKEKKRGLQHPHSENLLTSPEEQSKFIRTSFEKATSQSYKAMKKLVKVMDFLNGVVALLNQIIQLAPPSAPFSDTVMLESGGKKLSLRALLDEATGVRNSVDNLFTTLLSAKHFIIGSINRAIPARPVAPPGK